MENPFYSVLADLISNKVLIASLIALASSQTFKTTRRLLMKGKGGILAVFDYGGFPSTHSAFISACAFSCGLSGGFDSAAFAVAVVSSGIMISDILRLRMKVALDSQEIDRLLEKANLKREGKASQFGAHTKVEVLAGIVWGGVCAILVYFI